MSYYIVKTTFHYQNINDSSGDCFSSTAFQVFEFKDLETTETEVIDYCHTIFAKGLIRRIFGITVLHLPFPANFPNCEFRDEEEMAAITRELSNAGATTPEDEFKQFLVEVIEKTVRQFQSSEDETSNSLEKALYHLVIDENDIEEDV
jgi:hypothetical protein